MCVRSSREGRGRGRPHWDPIWNKFSGGAVPLQCWMTASSASGAGSLAAAYGHCTSNPCGAFGPVPSADDVSEAYRLVKTQQDMVAKARDQLATIRVQPVTEDESTPEMDEDSSHAEEAEQNLQHCESELDRLVREARRKWSMYASAAMQSDILAQHKAFINDFDAAREALEMQHDPEPDDIDPPMPSSPGGGVGWSVQLGGYHGLLPHSRIASRSPRSVRSALQVACSLERGVGAARPWTSDASLFAPPPSSRGVATAVSQPTAHTDPRRACTPGTQMRAGPSSVQPPWSAPWATSRASEGHWESRSALSAALAAGPSAASALDGWSTAHRPSAIRSVSSRTSLRPLTTAHSVRSTAARSTAARSIASADSPWQRAKSMLAPLGEGELAGAPLTRVLSSDVGAAPSMGSVGGDALTSETYEAARASYLAARRDAAASSKASQLSLVPKPSLLRRSPTIRSQPSATW